MSIIHFIKDKLGIIKLNCYSHRSLLFVKHIKNGFPKLIVNLNDQEIILILPLTL